MGLCSTYVLVAVRRRFVSIRLKALARTSSPRSPPLDVRDPTYLLLPLYPLIPHDIPVLSRSISLASSIALRRLGLSWCRRILTITRIRISYCGIYYSARCKLPCEVSLVIIVVTVPVVSRHVALPVPKIHVITVRPRCLSLVVSSFVRVE